MCFSEQFLSGVLPIWAPKGVRAGGPTKNPRTFSSATFWWGHLGSPRLPIFLPKNIKMSPKSTLTMTTKCAKTASRRPVNEPYHSRNKSIDRWFDPGTVASLPQAVGYIHIYVIICYPIILYSFIQLSRPPDVPGSSI